MSRQQQHSKQVWEDFWQEKAEIEQVYSNSDRIINQLKSLGDLDRKWVLEVGAGSGRDSFHLAKSGAKVITLDYAKSSLDMIKKISEKTGQSVQLVQADAFRLPFKDDKIDIVFHQGLLEHFTNPQGIVSENFRVIKPGGYTCADVPQRYHLYTVVKHILIWLNKWFAGWETEFSKPQLEKIFTSCGFSIHRVYGDWMRPSFIYRVFREALKKIGIKLPLYPKGLSGFSSIRRFFRENFRKTSLSYFTFMDIGVIGTKLKN
jgi:ubiquinone/menaquinone biosynthesis C-methylase UbiE